MFHIYSTPMYFFINVIIPKKIIGKTLNINCRIQYHLMRLKTVVPGFI